MVPPNNPIDPVSKKLTLLMTILVGAMAAVLVIAQSGYTRFNSELSMFLLSEHADKLRQISDPIERDKYSNDYNSEARGLDKILAPDARVFCSDMLGPTNSPKLGYYFIIRNYLFPRDVEISLGTNLIYRESGFEGTPCDSPAVLRTNGFDFLINYDRQELLPLTAKALK
ncbi:MAG TPA: hypothetical protein VGI03_00170 [Verrucomicrobiae bacterium]